MEFIVKIHLGNDAMRTGENISMALAGVAGKLEELPGYLNPITMADATARTITDDNGATVGKWSITE
jgi:hypothetical protein